MGYKICCDKCKSGNWRTQEFLPSRDIHDILCKNCGWEGSAEVGLDVILWDWDAPDQERIISDEEYFKGQEPKNKRKVSKGNTKRRK